MIYRPETERASHYFLADLPRQFDMVVHYDTTRPVVPLQAPGETQDIESRESDSPETFPTGI